jgi:MFS family permease
MISKEKEATTAEIENLKDDVQHPTNLDDFDQKRAQKLRHRVDWRLLPALAAMYSICLLDRNNLSNAAIAGMNVELNMVTGFGYNLVNMCFFITYILLQPLAILVCRWMGPRTFLPLICFVWGCVIIGAGFSPTWPTLLGCRLILGVLESGYFPGCLYLISTWYTRCRWALRGQINRTNIVLVECARRYSIFYLVGSCASALSGILAYGLQQLHGIHGLGGWRWYGFSIIIQFQTLTNPRIFILEGVITVAVAGFAAIFLVKFPDEELTKPSLKFLKSEDLGFITARLDADRGDVEADPFAWSKFLEPATEWFIYGFPFLLMHVSFPSDGPLHF